MCIRSRLRTWARQSGHRRYREDPAFQPASHFAANCIHSSALAVRINPLFVIAQPYKPFLANMLSIAFPFLSRIEKSQDVFSAVSIGGEQYHMFWNDADHAGFRVVPPELSISGK